MVPVVEFPPGFPFTDHATAVLEVPLTLTVICCWFPRNIVAVAGETATVTVGVGVGEGEPPDDFPPAVPQPDRKRRPRVVKTNTLETR